MVNKIDEVEMTDMTLLGSLSLCNIFLIMRKQTTTNLVAYNNTDLSLTVLEVRILMLVSRLYFSGVSRERSISWSFLTLEPVSNLYLVPQSL